MKFLLFRLPQERGVKMIKNKEAVGKIASFFPFRGDKSESLYSDEILEISENQVIKVLNSVEFPENKIVEIRFPSRAEYLEKINCAIDVVKGNYWQKLVISRPVLVPFRKLDLPQTFLRLCEKYPQAFCYVWCDEKRIWVGATPELLGKYHHKDSVFETMSLAGTLPVKENWTAKEIEEQKSVTDCIKSLIFKYDKEVQISKTTDYVLGEIKHLKTDFKAKISENDLEDLIKELHPTPAVCGFPKEDCQAKILEIENYDREFYSGYLKIKTMELTYFFVNIRCMQIFENAAVIYAGGGVTTKSSPEKEWQETELKSKGILEKIAMEK